MQEGQEGQEGQDDGQEDGPEEGQEDGQEEGCEDMQERFGAVATVKQYSILVINRWGGFEGKLGQRGFAYPNNKYH